jgi:hypothetical protein
MKKQNCLFGKDENDKGLATALGGKQPGKQ